MPKDTRLYARFDIGMDENAKIARLSDAAFRALIEATFYSRRQLTDGFLDGFIAEKRWGHVLAELTSNHPERPSLVVVEGGYQIRDYGDHQTTSADIQAKREYGRRGGLAKASKKVAGASDQLEQKASNTSSKTLAKTETETETTTTDVVVHVRPSQTLFDQAYKHWPKKVNKKAAYAKFVLMCRKFPTPEDLAQQIIRFGDAYAVSTSRQFTPGLAVWLGNERWTDELPQPAPTATRNTDAVLGVLEMGRQWQAQEDRKVLA